MRLLMMMMMMLIRNEMNCVGPRSHNDQSEREGIEIV